MNLVTLDDLNILPNVIKKEILKWFGRYVIYCNIIYDIPHLNYYTNKSYNYVCDVFNSYDYIPSYSNLNIENIETFDLSPSYRKSLMNCVNQNDIFMAKFPLFDHSYDRHDMIIKIYIMNIDDLDCLLLCAKSISHV